MTRKQANYIAGEIKKTGVLPAYRLASRKALAEEIYSNTESVSYYAFKVELDYLQAGRIDECDKLGDIEIMINHPEMLDWLI